MLLLGCRGFSGTFMAHFKPHSLLCHIQSILLYMSLSLMKWWMDVRWTIPWRLRGFTSFACVLHWSLVGWLCIKPVQREFLVLHRDLRVSVGYIDRRLVSLLTLRKSCRPPCIWSVRPCRRERQQINGSSHCKQKPKRSQTHFILHKCQSKHARAGLRPPSVCLSVCLSLESGRASRNDKVVTPSRPLKHTD